jgi:hypothetical protein
MAAMAMSGVRGMGTAFGSVSATKGIACVFVSRQSAENAPTNCIIFDLSVEL